MTINEFKAFLEGMDLKDAPTPEQWDRIKRKIDDLELLSHSVPRTWLEYAGPATSDSGSIPPVFPPFTTC